jgi:hypothetical protein
MINLPAAKFDALDSEVRELLTPRGFAVGKQERGGLFGSHRTDYTRGNECVTLFYDGRDNAVSLSYAKEPGQVSSLLSIPLSLKFAAELERFTRQIGERLHAI